MDDSPGYQKKAEFTVEERECADTYGREGRTSWQWALVNPMGRTLSGFGRNKKRAEFVARYENDRLFGRLGKC